MCDITRVTSHVCPTTPTQQVYEKAECEAMGMGCYLGVAEASKEPPKFIHLAYKPKGDST
jgi:leucyl aminopeptidase